MQHAQRAQQPRHERQLKNNPHHKNQHQEGIHVAVKRYLVGNHLAHMIVGKESQGHGKHDEVAHCHTDKEHQATDEKRQLDASLLIGIKRWRDKSPQLIQYKRERQHQRQPERCGHVDKEL